MEVAWTRKCISLSQRKYVLVQKETGRLGCKQVETPMDTSAKLGIKEDSAPMDKV